MRYSLVVRHQARAGPCGKIGREEIAPMVAHVPARSFVPREFDPADWSQVEPLYRELLGREVESAAALERWLADFSELSSVVDEYGSRRYIDKSCHTDDEGIRARYL